MTVLCKNYLASQKKYLKKVTVETPFIQPILSANGTLGGDNFAVYSPNNYGSGWEPYRAFDGGISYGWASSTYSPSDTYYIFYNPVSINVTNINITNKNIVNSDNSIKTGEVYGSDDNVTFVKIKDFTNNVFATGSNWNIDLSNNSNFYKYYKLHLTETAVNSSRYTIGEITITATEQTEVWQECSKAEYDLLPNADRRIENRYMAEVGKKYLKKVTVETPFIQPILSANGTLGGDSFAVSATNVYGNQQPYLAFDNNTSTYFQSNSGITDLTLYNPQPINITSLKVLNYYTATYVITALTVYGSDDNSNWTTIPSSFTQPNGSGYQTITLQNSNRYKYYKFALTCNAIREITITATELTVIYQEITKAEYDTLSVNNRRIENRYSLLKAV